MEWHKGRFEDRAVLVTGVSSGIGKATAQRLAAEGATVIGADITGAPEIEAGPGRFVFIHTDITDDEAAVEAVSTAVEICGRLDGLLHAAGISGGNPFHQLQRDTWDHLITTNLTGTYVMAKAALAQMLAQDPDDADGERGTIVAISSIEALSAGAASAAYSAAAAGIVQVIRTVATHYGPKGIRANVICPGVVDTPMSRDAFGAPGMGDVGDSYREAHALRRFARADEVAAAAAFLLSGDASFVSGTTLSVDGGYTAGRDHGITQMLGLHGDD